MKLEPFNVEKPVIGVIHLPPLPGSPRFSGDLSEIVERAVREARILEDCGVNGVIVENFWDVPFKVRVRDAETIASMTVIVKNIVDEVNIPVGVSLLRNSGVEALAIAYACNAKFIRVNALCQVIVAPEGILYPIARELIELKYKLKSNVRIYADVNVKHGKPLVERDIVDVAKECIERGMAEAIILTGSRTGKVVELNDILKLRKAKLGKPIVVGSGINLNNIAKYWSIADGFIVGTYFRVNGDLSKPIDRERVNKLMREVERLRVDSGKSPTQLLI